MSILPLMDQAPGLASRVFITLGIILLVSVER